MKQLNVLNKVNTTRTSVDEEPIQIMSHIPWVIDYESFWMQGKTETILSQDTVQHEHYNSNSEWDWQSYSYRIESIQSVGRNKAYFSQDEVRILLYWVRFSLRSFVFFVSEKLIKFDKVCRRLQIATKSAVFHPDIIYSNFTAYVARSRWTCFTRFVGLIDYVVWLIVLILKELFNTIEHSTLHSLLNFASADHNLENFGDTSLWIILFCQIGDDRFLANLRANQKSSFYLTFDSIQVFLIRSWFKSYNLFKKKIF